MVTDRLGALDVTHDAGLRAYLPARGSADAGHRFLTDAAIDRRCTVAPRGTVAVIRCPGAVDPVARLGPGQAYVTVDAYYQSREDTGRDDLTVDGYQGAVESFSGASSDAGCALHAPGGGTQIELTPIAARIQPSLVEVDACFGAHAAAAKRAFDLMVRAARIHTRADEAVPVPHTAPCTARDLSVRQQKPLGVSSAETNLIFRVTNTRAATCHIGGRPSVQAYRGATRLPFRTTSVSLGNGNPHVLYLHHGQHATLLLDVRTCDIAGGPDGFPTATRLDIGLVPGDAPAVVRLIRHQLDFCSEPVGVSALDGS